MRSRNRVAHIRYTKTKMLITSTYDAEFVLALKHATTSRRWKPQNKEWIVNIDERKNALEVIHRFYDTVIEKNEAQLGQKLKSKAKSLVGGETNITRKQLSRGLEVWIDGACEPVNPGGTATYGLVIKEKHKTLLREARVVGSGKGMSNNVAEYSGLIAFLDWYGTSKRKGKANIYSDSELLVNQMKGIYRAKRGTKKGLYYPYYQRARELIRQLGNNFHFEWIPREQNTEADELSKQALEYAVAE